jgi:nickel-type superoxide dismutase maturation protease
MIAPRRAGTAVVFVLGTVCTIATLRITRAYAVTGDSMGPTLNDGDYVQGLRLPRGWRPTVLLRPGAIVVARRPDRPEIDVIKRIASREANGALRLTGDNPVASTDSRHFGPVAPSAVESVIWLRYWPPHRARLLVGRFRRPTNSGWTGHPS